MLAAGLLAAQPFSIGIKGGVPLTGDLDSYWATSESRRYTVGPMVTAALPAGFRVEFDALYRRVGYRFSSTDSLGDLFFERDRGNSWEFPIVLRRSLWRGLYAGVGYAPRVINGSAHIDSTSITSLNPFTTSHQEFSVPGYWQTTHGIVGSAGIERRLGPLRIAPEVRYTYWSASSIERYGSRGFFVVSAQHQVELLLGLTVP